MNAPSPSELVALVAAPERTYAIAYVRHKSASIDSCKAHTWKTIAAGLGKTVLGKKDGKGWLPADIAVGSRKQERVKSVSLLVLDIEAEAHPAKDESGKPRLDHNGDVIKIVTGKEPPTFDEIIAELDLWGWRYIVHTSYGHTEEHPRYRIVLELSRSLVKGKTEHEMRTLAVHVAGMLGLSYCMDTSCLESSRLFYTPRAPADRLALFRSANGGTNPLDVSKLLDDAERIHQAQQKRVKETKPGKTGQVINTFNDNHDAGDIVDGHPESYEPKGPGRWLYCESTTGMPGVRVLPEKNGKSTVYSSHSGDALNTGHAHDAFSVYCILNHGGNVSDAVKAAAKILGLDGRNEPPVRFEDVAADFPLIEVESPATLPPVPPVSYPAPFRGAMADIVAAAVAVAAKPQPDLCTLAALLGMSGACAGIYALPSGMRLNLYGCGVAGTGEGKDAPRSVAIELTRAAGGNLLGKPASGQGLEDALPDSGASLIAVDEIGHFFSAVNNGKAPPHLIELAGTLLQLFSASKGRYQTRVRAASRGSIASRVIRNPVVSLLGFSTPEVLGMSMGVSNIEDGLLGRFLFAFGQEGVTPRRGGGAFTLPDSVKTAAEALQAGISTAEFITGLDETDAITIRIEDDAEARLCRMLEQFDRQRREVKTTFGKALLTRSCEKAERVAGVLAVWDCPAEPVMTLEHVAWAEALMIASDEALTRFSTDFMHGGETQANAQRVLKLIPRILKGEMKPQKTHEGKLLSKGLAPYSMVLRSSKLDKRALDDAMEYLFDLKEVHCIEVETGHINGKKSISRGVELL